MMKRLRHALLLMLLSAAAVGILSAHAGAYTTYSYPSMPANAASMSVTIGSVTLPLSDYPSGSYWDPEKSTMTVAEGAKYGLNLSGDINLRGWTCVSFGRYVYAALFYRYPQDASIDGKIGYDPTSSYAYTNIISSVMGQSSVAAGYSASTLKTVITAARPGALMRLSGHTVMIMAIFNDGLVIYDANGTSTENTVAVRAYTWQEFVDAWGGRAIEAIHVPTYYPGYSYSSVGSGSSTPAANYTIDADSAGTYEVYNCTQVNVRSTPSSSSSLVTTIVAGTKISILGNYGSWYAYTYNGSTCWIYKDYLKKATAATSTTTSGGTKYVVYNCTLLNARSSAAFGNNIVTTIPAGTVLTVTATSGDWSAATYNGQQIWVNNAYIKLSDDQTAATPDEDTEDTTEPETTQGDSYKVINCTKLNARNAAGFSGSVVTTIPAGTVLNITETSGLWYKTSYDNKTVWVYSTYLEKVTQSTDTGTETTTTPTTQGENYKVVDCTKLNARSTASFGNNIVTTIPAGTVLTVTASSGSWRQVTYSGKTLWVSSDYLEKTSAAASESTGSSDSSTTTTTTTSENYKVVDCTKLNARSTASFGNNIVTTIPVGTVLTVTSSSGSWRQVTYNGKTLWVSISYLEKTTAAASASTTTTEEKKEETSTEEKKEETTTTPDDDDDDDNGENTYQVYNCNYLNARASGSTNAQLVTTIPVGTVLNVEKEAYGWYQVTYDNKTVWVYGLYLKQVASTTSSSSVVTGDTARVVNCYAVYFHESADADSTSVGSIPAGAELTILETYEGWCKVTYRGKTGWLTNYYLEKC